MFVFVVEGELQTCLQMVFSMATKMMRRTGESDGGSRMTTNRRSRRFRGVYVAAVLGLLVALIRGIGMYKYIQFRMRIFVSYENSSYFKHFR